jgi:hypothetical protein
MGFSKSRKTFMRLVVNRNAAEWATVAGPVNLTAFKVLNA